jgi:hypothetical protein
MASPARAAINQPVAVWQMNESAGARTMVDSSGNGINGVIGTDVLAGTALTGGGTGYPAAATLSSPTGTIANTRPLTIAGKLNCDQVNTTCDYFAGDLDYLKIETS